jgi:hypothetical protein
MIHYRKPNHGEGRKFDIDLFESPRSLLAGTSSKGDPHIFGFLPVQFGFSH